MNEKDLRALIFIVALLIVGLSTPSVKGYFDQLFNAILSAVFIGVLILIVGAGVWFFFFKDR